MGKETRLFKSEETKNRTDVGEFLRQIAEKIANGEVVLRRGQDELVLQFPMNLILSMFTLFRRHSKKMISKA